MKCFVHLTDIADVPLEDSRPSCVGCELEVWKRDVSISAIWVSFRTFLLQRWSIALGDPGRTCSWAGITEIYGRFSCCICVWPSQLAKHSGWWLQIDRKIDGGVRCVPSCRPSVSRKLTVMSLRGHKKWWLCSEFQPMVQRGSLLSSIILLALLLSFLGKHIHSLCSAGPFMLSFTT